MVTSVKKRDGRIVKYDTEKVSNAILQAAISVLGDSCIGEYRDLAFKYAKDVRWIVNSLYNDRDIPSVENIQDIVEKVLINHKEDRIVKEYILYRNNRTKSREMNNRLMSDIRDIISKSSEEVDMKRENANIDGETSMGVMLKIGSETSKQVYKDYYMRPEIARAHNSGDIHVHDADFAMLGTTTCTQIDIGKLLDNGFNTGHGFIRRPSNIISAAALACIAIQSNQNDQHGGQSIPMFDYGLQKYVGKSYIKNIINVLKIKYDISDDRLNIINNKLLELYEKDGTILNNDNNVLNIINGVVNA